MLLTKLMCAFGIAQSAVHGNCNRSNDYPFVFCMNLMRDAQVRAFNQLQ